MTSDAAARRTILGLIRDVLRRRGVMGRFWRYHAATRHAIPWSEEAEGVDPAVVEHDHEHHHHHHYPEGVRPGQEQPQQIIESTGPSPELPTRPPVTGTSPKADPSIPKAPGGAPPSSTGGRPVDAGGGGSQQPPPPLSPPNRETQGGATRPTTPGPSPTPSPPTPQPATPTRPVIRPDARPGAPATTAPWLKWAALAALGAAGAGAVGVGVGQMMTGRDGQSWMPHMSPLDWLEQRGDNLP